MQKHQTSIKQNKNKIKKWFKRIIGLELYHKKRKERRDRKLHALRQQYFPVLRSVVNDDTSIITSNCFAGLIMQDLGLKYNSPTLGLYFMYPDYIEFLKNLKFYLKEAELKFVEQSKYPLGNQRREKAKEWYPIGVLDEKVEIHFLHYHSEEEAATKWHRRAERVNMDDLLIIGMDQNLCTAKDVEDFEDLEFEKKIMFSTHQNPSCPSNIYIPEFEGLGQVGDPYRKGHIFYKYLCEKIAHIKN